MNIARDTRRPLAAIVAGLLAMLAATFALVVAGTEKAEAAFPGKNGKIALSIDRNNNEDIYTINPDGSKERRLTTDPDDERNPDWSPNGRRIVFNDVRVSGSGPNIQVDTEIFVINADGTKLRQLTDLPGTNGNFGPAFSPNGKKIAFIRSQGSDNDLMVMDADGSNVREVSQGEATFGVVFSPDGKKLIYSRDTGSFNIDVHSVNLDGTGDTKLTTDPDLDAVADISPDGGKIAFFTNRQSFSDVFVMNADGSDEKFFTEDTDASFSPNGKKVVLETSTGLAVANAADASGKVNIVPNSVGNENGPDWGPVAKRNK